MPEEFATRRDLNGLGTKVNGVSSLQAAQTVRIDRNEKDIGEIWKAIDVLRETLTRMTGKMGMIMGVGLGATFLVSLATLILQFVKG